MVKVKKLKKIKLVKIPFLAQTGEHINSEILTQIANGVDTFSRLKKVLKIPKKSDERFAFFLSELIFDSKIGIEHIHTDWWSHRLFLGETSQVVTRWDNEDKINYIQINNPNFAKRQQLFDTDTCRYFLIK